MVEKQWRSRFDFYFVFESGRLKFLFVDKFQFNEWLSCSSTLIVWKRNKLMSFVAFYVFVNIVIDGELLEQIELTENRKLKF